MNRLAHDALSLARSIQEDIPKRGKPPQDGVRPDSEQVLPSSLSKGTRGYIERVVNQINGCYEDGWFDACSVMIRRLVETLLIETFEDHGIENKIQTSSGNFLPLGDMIDKTLAETSWNLSRSTKRSLPKLKLIGDWAAHSRRYNAHRHDVDKVIDDLRVVVQEFIYLANLK